MPIPNTRKLIRLEQVHKSAKMLERNAPKGDSLKQVIKFARKIKRRIAQEKTDLKYTSTLAERYVDFVKKPYRKKLRKSITHTLDFIPREMVRSLMRRTKSKRKEELVHKLIERIIFLPDHEFRKLILHLGGSTKRNTPAISTQEHSFINIKYANRQRINESIIHEIIHTICEVNGKQFRDEYNEALPVALELFVDAQMKKSKLPLLVKKAKTDYTYPKDPKKYKIGVNTGRRIFLIANELEKAHGIKAVRFFFNDLFRSSVLSDFALESATKAAKEKHPR